MAEGAEDKSGAFAKTIATTLPIITTAIGLFGVKDGTLTRIILNSGWLFVWPVLLLVISIVIATFAAIAVGAVTDQPDADSNDKRTLGSRAVPTKPKPKTRFFKSTSWRITIIADCIAIVFFLAGVAWIGGLAVETAAENERPRIAGKLTIASDGIPTLEATISAEGLRAEEHVVITVFGRSTRATLRQDRTGRSTALSESNQQDETNQPHKQLVFATRTGPDRDGKVDRTFTVPLTAGLYDILDVQADIRQKVGELEGAACDERSGDIACLSFWLPQPSVAPHLGLTWEPGERTQVLSITSKAGGVPSEGGIRLRVLGRSSRTDEWSTPIHTSLISPTANGTVDSNTKVPLVPDYSSICVVAFMFDHLLPKEAGSVPKGCPAAGIGRAVIRTSVPQPEPSPSPTRT